MSDEITKDDAVEIQPAATWRLGWEAKIGVTVIVVLLIALGAAVAYRLKGLGAANTFASAAASESEAEKLKGPSTTDALLQETKAKYFGSHAATLVSAKAAPAQPPKTTGGEGDPWKLASDRYESKTAQNGSSMPSAPPSFMPDPPKPSHAEQADRAEPRAFAPPTAKDQPPRLLDAPKALADAKPLRGVDGSRVQRVGPGDEGVRPVSGQGPALIGGSSPVAASAPPAPSRASLPAEPPTPPQPPASLPTGPSYSAGVSGSPAPMPVVQLAADDYRREPASSRSSSSEPRRAVAASSYNPPARRDDGKYEVQPNDSYWTISEKVYGAGAYFKALEQHNRGKSGEERLKPGELILAPPLAELEKLYPLLCPRASRREAQQSQTQSRVSAVGLRGSGRGGRTYTVLEGDTLFNIARNELGKASRWAEIYDLNRDVLGKDFNYLTPGTQLSLPEGPRSDVTAQPPSDAYRR